jgi:YD repeat-containing protein
MQNNLFNKLIISLLATIFFVSCSKKADVAATPQNCYLASISNTKGNILEKFTYDAKDQLVTDARDSSGTVYSFTYNAQSLVDKIAVTVKNSSGSFAYSLNFTYDVSGKTTKAVAVVQGTTYQTNIFTYTNGQLTKITTTDYQSNLLVTRLEYTGENISKVYQQFDTDKEYLYYEVSKFDDKKNFYPEAYRAFALGHIGLEDNFIFLNKNNVLSEKFYDEISGAVNYTSDNTYEYNSTSQPTKITSAINYLGKKSTASNTYQYTCK